MNTGKVTTPEKQFFCNPSEAGCSNYKQITEIMATLKQLQTTLRLTYGLVPIVAGLDKFTNLLTQWSDYLGNNKSMLPLDPLSFMKIVGVIEIVAGILVLVRPLIGAYVVMAWLICIALQLLVGGHYFDVAVRDLVMAIGAYTLAQLTKATGSDRP
jgi:uncharacterized membrane protein YphA (DoxX/SURF4 family)